MTAVRPIIASNEVARIASHVRKGEGRNKGKYFVLLDSLRYTFHLLEFLAEAFRCHVHHFQCLENYVHR